MQQPSTPDEVVRAWATLREMFHDRGADASAMDHMSDAQLREMAERLAVFSVDVTMPTSSVRVIFCLAGKLRMSDLVRRMSLDTNNVVIARDKLTPNSAKALKDMPHEVFELRELQYNVTRHYLVPKHEPIRDEQEISRIVAGLHIKSKLHMPLISRSDPVARYYALKPGQLVRIVRPSQSAGDYGLYRCCA